MREKEEREKEREMGSSWEEEEEGEEIGKRKLKIVGLKEREKVLLK